MKKSSSKILLICPHGIGDFLMTLQGTSQLIKNTDLYFLFKDRANINYELLTRIEKTYDNKFKPYIYDKQNLYIKGIELLPIPFVPRIWVRVLSSSIISLPSP